jgi:hypothetical protein
VGGAVTVPGDLVVLGNGSGSLHGTTVTGVEQRHSSAVRRADRGGNAHLRG